MTDRKNLAKWIIAIVVPIIILCVPINETFTQDIRTFLAITACGILIIAFEFFNPIVPGILLPASYLIFGIADGSTVYAGWTGNIPMTVVGCFLLASVLNETGVMERIAYWCIVKTGGSYRGIVFGVFLAGVILSLLTSVQAYVMMAAICFGVCAALNLKRSPESAVIMLAGALGSVSSSQFIYHPPFMAFVLSSAQAIDSSFDVTWIQWLLQNFPWCIYFIILLFILTKFFKPTQKIDGKDDFRKKYEELGPVSMKEKKALGLTLLIMLYMVFGSFLGWNINYAFIVGPWLFFLPGINIATEESVKNINWSMAFFLVGFLSIGNVANSLGFGQIICDLVVPYLRDMNATVIYGLIWLIGVSLNFLLTPLAIMASVAAPVAQVGSALGIDPAGIVYILFAGTDQLLLPYEITGYLIFFSFGMIATKDLFKMCGIKMVLHLIFLMVVMIPWWKFIGVL